MRGVREGWKEIIKQLKGVKANWGVKGEGEGERKKSRRQDGKGHMCQLSKKTKQMGGRLERKLSRACKHVQVWKGMKESRHIEGGGGSDWVSVCRRRGGNKKWKPGCSFNTLIKYALTEVFKVTFLLPVMQCLGLFLCCLNWIFLCSKLWFCNWSPNRQIKQIYTFPPCN